MRSEVTEEIDRVDPDKIAGMPDVSLGNINVVSGGTFEGIIDVLYDAAMGRDFTSDA